MKRALILIVCLLLFPVVPASALVTRPVTVKVFCTGNLHGHAEADFDADGRLREIGYARMKTYMDSQKADLRLLLDAGDVFSGSPLATYSKGRSIGELINAMGYAAVAPGTHDFDHGYDALKGLAAKVDLLSINAYENEESAFKPYRLYDIDGLTIGIFGVISPDVSRYAPEGALRFDADLARRCSDIVDELRSDMGVDAVIALTHLGMRPMEGVNARRLAAEVRGIDLIIDGGDHDIVAGEVIGNTTIVSAGEYFQCFGEITLQFDPDEKLAIEVQMHDAADLRGVPGDIGVTALLNDLLDPVLDRSRGTVGSTPIELNGRTEALRAGETNLGRLVTSALQEAAQSDIALCGAGDIGASIDKGRVGLRDLRAALPYADDVVVVRMTGEALWKLLNRAFLVGAESFPHFAGIAVDVFPAGVERVTGIQHSYRVSDIRVNGEALDLRRAYAVALPRRFYQSAFLHDHAIVDASATMEDAVTMYLANADFRALNAERRLRRVDAPERFSGYGDARSAFERFEEFISQK